MPLFLTHRRPQANQQPLSRNSVIKWGFCRNPVEWSYQINSLFVFWPWCTNMITDSSKCMKILFVLSFCQAGNCPYSQWVWLWSELQWKCPNFFLISLFLPLTWNNMEQSVTTRNKEMLQVEWNAQNSKNNNLGYYDSDTGNRTPSYRVRGGNVSRYTISD